MSTCKVCGAGIQWARNDRGKYIPFDEMPVSLGEYVLIVEHNGSVPTPVRFSDLPPLDAVAFRERVNPHFKTCASRRTRAK